MVPKSCPLLVEQAQCFGHLRVPPREPYVQEGVRHILRQVVRSLRGVVMGAVAPARIQVEPAAIVPRQRQAAATGCVSGARSSDVFTISGKRRSLSRRTCR